MRRWRLEGIRHYTGESERRMEGIYLIIVAEDSINVVVGYFSGTLKKGSFEEVLLHWN